MSAVPPSTDVASESAPSPPGRDGRALAVGGVALAVLFGVAFGQVTGSLSDVATGARDVAPAVGANPAGGGRPVVVDPPPTSVPPPTDPSPTTDPATDTAATDTAATDTAAADTATDSTTTDPTRPASYPRELLVSAGGTLAPGRRGLAVRALQARLDELGYWPGPLDGAYTELTRQAVLAFQKAEDLDRRDGVADAEVRERLAEASFGWGRSRSGTVVEIDRDRQLLLVVEDGAVRWTFHTATGPLPRGRYRVEREIDAHYDAPRGTIHRPKYFDGTVAVQGTGATPAPPAGGCGCLSDAAMDFLWSTDAVGTGTAVLVY